MWCHVSNILLSLFKGFVKVVKNKAYFKRYQVKFRRRRGMAQFPVLLNYVILTNIVTFFNMFSTL